MSEPKVIKRKKPSMPNSESHASPKKRATGKGNTSPYFKTMDVETSTASATGKTLSLNDESNSKRCTFNFYNQSCVSLAKALLGKVLVRLSDTGERISGRIVETECYLGAEDHASHTYNGKRTARNEPMFMTPGTAYVYHIYGMYCCFNISSKGEGAAVLIRGLDAVEGTDTMRMLRGAKRADKGDTLKHKHLCNGPSKLTIALNIHKDDVNKHDLSSSPHIWVEDGETVAEEVIVKCPRIGIKCSDEWLKAPLRFYVKDSVGVSVINKLAKS